MLYTCEDKASNFELWGEYIDPDATMSELEFNALTVDEKLNIIHEVFPNECDCNLMSL